MDNDSPKNHPARSIEYDDWIQREEKKYSRLLTELKKASWFIQSSPQKGDVQTGSLKFVAGKPHGAGCVVSLVQDEHLSSELEATRLTDDEVRHGCGLTMEQALLGHQKPPALEKDECMNKNGTQNSMAFQYTLSVRGRNSSRSLMKESIPPARNTLSESIGSESISVNRLWLEIGETYTNFSEYDSTAAINSTGPEPSRRIGNLHPGSSWHQPVLPIPWDSVMVESVGLVMQRWRGVCSFSHTMRSTRSGENHDNVFILCPKKRSRPGD
jgi:hypothetical protein